MTGLDDIVLNSFNQCCRNIGDNKTTTGTGRVRAQPDEIDLKLTQADFRRNVEREDRLRVYDARGAKTVQLLKPLDAGLYKRIENRIEAGRTVEISRRNEALSEGDNLGAVHTEFEWRRGHCRPAPLPDERRELRDGGFRCRNCVD